MGRAGFAWRERRSRRLNPGLRRPAGPASSSFGFIAGLARAWRAAACALVAILVLGACSGGGGGGGGAPPGRSGSDAGKLRLLAATVQGATLTMTFNRRLDPNSVPGTARFIVRFTNSNKDSLRPTGTRVDGKTIVLTLSSAVDENDGMELDYNSTGCSENDGVGPCIQDLEGNVAPLIEVWLVTYAPPPPDGGPYPSPGRGVQKGASPSGNAAQVNGLMKRTLAEVGRRTLTDALDNIGERLAPSVPSSSLTLAGETVALAAPPAAGLADGERTCPAGVSGGQAGFAADRGGCASDAWSRSVRAGELFHASAFSLTLGAPEGPGAPSPPLWSVWGRGDFGSFAGRPEPGTRYEAELRTGWLGIDARAGPWVAGLAVSRGTGKAEYGFEDGGVSGRGRSETSLTALYPYGRWTLSDGLEMSGVLGAGRGGARHRLNGDEPETSGLSMRMGSVGLRHELPRPAEIRLAARADASLVRMETGGGPGHADGLTADSWRARLGLEASRRLALDGETAFTPFVEAAGRRDGGDGLVGTGIEVAGGLRYTAPRLHLEARGRRLAAHSEEGTRESGVSVTARAGAGAHGRGLSLALSPRWGALAEGAGKLWHEEMPKGGSVESAGGFEGELGYGFGHFGGRFTGTPNVGFGASDGGGREVRIGWRLTPAAGGGSGFEVNLDATRRESANGNDPPAHGAMLTGSVRW